MRRLGESIMAVWGGANDRVSGAIIGPVGRGRLVAGECKETGGELAAACDVYKPESGGRVEGRFERREGLFGLWKTVGR